MAKIIRPGENIEDILKDPGRNAFFTAAIELYNQEQLEPYLSEVNGQTRRAWQSFAYHNGLAAAKARLTTLNSPDLIRSDVGRMKRGDLGPNTAKYIKRMEIYFATNDFYHQTEGINRSKLKKFTDRWLRENENSEFDSNAFTAILRVHHFLGNF